MGIELRGQPELANVVVDGDASLSQLHRRLLESGLDKAVLDALTRGVEGQDVAPDAPAAEYRAVLSALLGIDEDVDDTTAVDHRLVSRVASIVQQRRLAVDEESDTISDDDYPREQALEELREQWGRLGIGNVDGTASPLSDVDVTPRVLSATTDPTEHAAHVEVRLGHGFAGRDRRQREDVLEWLVQLALSVEIGLVVATRSARKRLANHDEVLPGHLTQAAIRARGLGLPAAASDERASQRERAAQHLATRARERLDADGTLTAIVAAVARSETESATYADLEHDLLLDRRPYQEVSRLEDQWGLVSVDERADGTTVVTLSEAGGAYIDAVYEEDGLQAPLPVCTAAEARRTRSRRSGPSRAVSADPPKSRPHAVLPRASTEGTPPDLDSTAADAAADAAAGASVAGSDADADRDAAAEAQRTEGSRVLDWNHGIVEPRFANRCEWMPTTEAAEDGAVTLANAGLDWLDDGRQALVSVDPDDDEVVLEAEYHSPLQYPTTIAHGLTWRHFLETIDMGGRLGADLDAFPAEIDLDVVVSAAGIGWTGGEELADAVDDDVVHAGDRLVDNLEDARDTLLEETGLLAEGDHDVGGRTDERGFDSERALRKLGRLDEDGQIPEEYEDVTVEEHRSLITKYALGLSSTMIRLLELVDVDVVLGMRVPTFAKHYSAEDDDNSKRRRDLVKHLGRWASINSAYGLYGGYKSHWEDREEHRPSTEPEVDAEDPMGELLPSIVVAGDGVAGHDPDHRVDGMASELRQELSRPERVVDEAPEWNAEIPVNRGLEPTATQRLAKRHLQHKGIEPTFEAVTAFAAYCSDPWTAMWAIDRGLEAESPRRGVHLDEVRTALQVLGPGDLFDATATPTQRAGIMVLLEADEPISQAELARRMGKTAQSWRNNRDGLIEAGIVEETHDGWRVTLPFKNERWAEPSTAPCEERGKDDRPAPPWFHVDEPSIEWDFGADTRAPTDVLWTLVDDGHGEALIPASEWARRAADADDPVARLEQAVIAGEEPPVEDLRALAAEIGVPWSVIQAGCRHRQPDPPSHTARMGPSLSQLPVSAENAGKELSNAGFGTGKHPPKSSPNGVVSDDD
mgnify:CR=1 FL=1